MSFIAECPICHKKQSTKLHKRKKNHISKTIARKAGVDKNIRMVIFGHANIDDMDSRYDIVDESDLLTAVDQIEVFLQSVDQDVDQTQKMALKQRAKSL